VRGRHNGIQAEQNLITNHANELHESNCGHRSLLTHVQSNWICERSVRATRNDSRSFAWFVIRFYSPWMPSERGMRRCRFLASLGM